MSGPNHDLPAHPSAAHRSPGHESPQPLPSPASRAAVHDRRTLDALRATLPPGRTLAEELQIAAGAGLILLGPDHREYPPRLREISRPPPFLYRQGMPGGSLPCVAIVGSRRASHAGERFAFRLARELAEAGCRVVSGLARGIDRAALEGAETAGGAPWAVLGNGLPRIYPPENRGLAERIVRGGGALLSELPCGAPPRRSHFPRRNRLISGLSLGVVIVEATDRSGSLITAGWALEQGREVLAVPGPVEGPGHGGCHRLIREGATLVTSVEEVLEALTRSPAAAASIAAPLREAFQEGERDLGVLLERTGLPPARLLEGWRRLLAEETAVSDSGLASQRPSDGSGSVS